MTRRLLRGAVWPARMVWWGLLEVTAYTITAASITVTSVGHWWQGRRENRRDRAERARRLRPGRHRQTDSMH